MATINPFDFFLEPEAETFPFTYDPVLDQELAPFRRLEEPGPLLKEFLAEIPREEQRTVDMLVDLNRRVQERTAYVVRTGTRRLDAGGDARQRAAAPAVTAPGCWCRRCGISASPPASSPAT